jgi:hypothetical protein
MSYFPTIRSDVSGSDVLGTSGSPITIPTTYTGSVLSSTRDYSDCVWHVTLASTGSGVTQVDVKVEWSEDGTNLSQQGSESITAGTSTLSKYEAQYDVSGETTQPFNLPAISLPVAGPNAKISIKAVGAADGTGYIRVWRKA